MKKVIFIVYQFPPLNVGGTQRPFRFINNLPKHNIKPIVFTLSPEDYCKVYDDPKTEDTKLQELHPEVELYHVSTEHLLNKKTGKASNFVRTYFNYHKGIEGTYWKQHLFNAVNSYLQNNTAELIFVTAPPFSILPLAKQLSSIHNIPFITDLRDPWTLWTMNPYGNYFIYLLAKHAERNILKKTRKIIATSEVTISDLIKLHPGISSDKYHYIPNSFEGSIEYQNICVEPKEDITIGYIGSFYYSPESRNNTFTPWYKKRGHRKLQYSPRKEDWLYRSPYYFFQSLEVFLNKYPSFKNKIIVKFAGRKEAWFDDMVNNFNLSANVEHLGWLNHEASLHFQKSCDYLLITSSKVIGGDDYSIAGKTFEYFKALKPIIAFVNNGAQKDILENSNSAIIFAPDAADKNSQIFKKLFTNGVKLKPNKDFIDSFNIENQTNRLAKILNEN